MTVLSARGSEFQSLGAVTEKDLLEILVCLVNQVQMGQSKCKDYLSLSGYFIIINLFLFY